MANKIYKPFSDRDGNQVLKASFNDVDHSITINGFLVSKIGAKITRSDVDSVTEDFSYYDNATLLYTFRLIYTDSTKADLVSAERIA